MKRVHEPVMNRREFIYTLGCAAASLLLPQLYAEDVSLPFKCSKRSTIKRQGVIGRIVDQRGKPIENGWAYIRSQDGQNILKVDRTPEYRWDWAKSSMEWMKWIGAEYSKEREEWIFEYQSCKDLGANTGYCFELEPGFYFLGGMWRGNKSKEVKIEIPSLWPGQRSVLERDIEIPAIYKPVEKDMDFLIEIDGMPGIAKTCFVSDMLRENANTLNISFYETPFSWKYGHRILGEGAIIVSIDNNMDLKSSELRVGNEIPMPPTYPERVAQFLFDVGKGLPFSTGHAMIEMGINVASDILKIVQKTEHEGYSIEHFRKNAKGRKNFAYPWEILPVKERFGLASFSPIELRLTLEGAGYVHIYMLISYEKARKGKAWYDIYEIFYFDSNKSAN